MSRLSKLQIYSIRWLNSEGQSIQKIASDLELTENQVLSTIEKYGVSKTKESDKNIKDKTSKVVGSKEKTTPATPEKKSSGVAIMTKEVSMQNDAIKDKVKSNHRYNDSCIYRQK